MRELEEQFVGCHVSNVCENAAALAHKDNEDIRFVFNDTEVIAHPGESAETLQARWSADSDAKREAWLNSDEYRQRETRRAEEYRLRCAASMREASQTEGDMCAAEVPWPYTLAQLSEYVDSLVERSHDYGTSAYAMSMAAVAAFNYVGHKLGTIGFQTSYADLDILRRTRSIKGPFMIIKAEDGLFPQYDLRRKLEEVLTEWRPWLQKEAREKLDDASNSQAHPDVRRRWEALAKGAAL